MKPESYKKSNKTLEKRFKDEFNYSNEQLEEISEKAYEVSYSRDRFLISRDVIVKAKRLNDAQKIEYLNTLISLLKEGFNTGEVEEIRDPSVNWALQDFLDDFKKSTEQYFNTIYNNELFKAIRKLEKDKPDGNKGGRPKKKEFTYDESIDFQNKYYSKRTHSELFKKKEEGSNSFILIDEDDAKVLKTRKKNSR